MTLRDYLTTQRGIYLLAESTVPLTVTSLDTHLLDQEVEVYALGQDVSGRLKLHLYVGQHHLVTQLADPVALPAISAASRTGPST